MIASKAVDAMLTYRTCGMVVRSPIALPFLASEAVVAGSVIVRCEPGDATVAGVTTGKSVLNECLPDSFAFTVAGLGRFGVIGGRELLVPSTDTARTGWVATVLLGSLLPHLCHQRGLVPLHAGAAVVGGRALAVAGPSGAGKSTLVAGLARRGWPILSDDLCAVDLSTGKPMAHSCAPWVKLCPDAAGDISDAQVIRDKVWVPLGSRFQDRPVPLSTVLVITDGQSDGPVEFLPLTGAGALCEAGQIVSRWRRAQKAMGMGVLFPRLTDLVGAVRFYRLVRPRVRARLDEVLDAIERFAPAQEA